MTIESGSKPEGSIALIEQRKVRIGDAKNVLKKVDKEIKGIRRHLARESAVNAMMLGTADD